MRHEKKPKSPHFRAVWRPQQVQIGPKIWAHMDSKLGPTWAKLGSQIGSQPAHMRAPAGDLPGSQREGPTHHLMPIILGPSGVSYEEIKVRTLSPNEARFSKSQSSPYRVGAWIYSTTNSGSKCIRNLIANQIPMRGSACLYEDLQGPTYSGL